MACQDAQPASWEELAARLEALDAGRAYDLSSAQLDDAMVMDGRPELTEVRRLRAPS